MTVFRHNTYEGGLQGTPVRSVGCGGYFVRQLEETAGNRDDFFRY